MKHTYWVIDGYLAGRPGPHKHPWSLKELRESGIGGIVSLDELPLAVNFAAAGLLHLDASQPMILLDDEPLREQFLTVMPAVLQFVEEVSSMQLATLIHCLHGCDRTGAVLACCLMERGGMSAAEAVDWIRRCNPHAMSAEGYEEAVYTYERLRRQPPAA